MQTPKLSAKKGGLHSSSSSSSSHQSTSRSSRSTSAHSRSLSRQSSTAVPIAEPFDPSKEAVEIQALTSSIILPTDSIPPLPSSPTQSSQAGSAIATPRLRFETFHAKVDYRHDGDRWMDTDVMMAKRRKLKQDEDILKWVTVFWRTFHHQLDDQAEQKEKKADSDEAGSAAATALSAAPAGEQPSAPATPLGSHCVEEEDDPFAPKPAPPAAEEASAAASAPPPPAFLRGRISRGQYMTVHALWFKALHKLYDRSDAHVQAIKDWARDSWLSSAASHDTLDYPAFVDALFELVDIWTLTVEASEYVHFLATLYHRVTRVKSWLADDSSIVTKMVWRKTRYVKPSAVYRPYQYMKYKNVQWKAAAEVIHHLDSDDSSDEEEGRQREEEQQDDALIQNLQQLSDDDASSSPDTQSDSSSSEEDEPPPPPLVPSHPPPARTPLLISSPAPIPRKLTAVPLPPLAIDPDRVLRRLSEVDVEPPKSPYLDPPAHIPLTPAHHPSSSDDSDEDTGRGERHSHRTRRASLLDLHPASSSDELSDTDGLTSPSALHAQARYNHAIDALEQQRQDRYLHLVTHLRTLLNTSTHRLQRSNSVVLWSQQGRATVDVDDALKASRTEMEDWELSHLPPSSTTQQQRRLRAMSRMEPIGCLVDDDERYFRLRGDGSRRHSAPGDIAAFSCAGPRVYAEGARPGAYEEPARRSREAPRMEGMEAARLEWAARAVVGGEEERGVEVKPAVVPAVVKEVRPETSDMEQEDFARYMAELTEQAAPPPPPAKPTPGSTQPPASEASASTQPAPAASARQVGRRTRPAAAGSAAGEAVSEGSTAVASPVSGATPQPSTQGKKKKPEVRPPSPVFAQSRRMSVAADPHTTPIARKATKVRGLSGVEEEKKPPAVTASPPPKPTLPSPPATAPAAAPSPPATSEAAPAEPAPSSPEAPAEMSDVVRNLIARRRGTVNAAAKLVAMRDQRLANLGAVNIRDEALAAEYDEEAGRRGSASRSNMKALREVEDEEGGGEAKKEEGEEEKGEVVKPQMTDDERLMASIRKAKEADARRRKEEEEKRKKRDEDERKALEEKMAALKAEKEIFSLLHEAETQRKVEAQLKQQKKDLIHKEKANRRRKEKEEREKAAEAAALADQEASETQKASEGDEGSDPARPPKFDRRSSARGSVIQQRSRTASKGHAAAIAESGKRGSIVEEREDEPHVSSSGEAAKKAAGVVDAKKDPAAAKKAAAERKAKLDEEARARTEALKERQEAEAEAAKQHVPVKKVLKAKVVAKKPAEEAATAPVEEEEEGRVRIRADFMRSKKLDRSEVEEEQPPADVEAEEVKEEDGHDGKEAKGEWRKEKAKRVRAEEAADSASALPPAVQSPKPQRSQGHKAAPTVSRKAKPAEAAMEAEQSAADGATEKRKKESKAKKETKPRQPQGTEQEAEAVGEDSSLARPLGGGFAKEVIKKAEPTEEPAVSTESSSSTSSPLRSPKALRSPGKRRAARVARKAVDAAESAELLAEEKEKFAFGADWSLEKKRAYREAEYAKEKEEEKAALVKSGEHGLVELKWAQKVEELKRKEERQLRLEEKEKKMREIEDSKKERAAQKEREKAAKEREKLQAKMATARRPAEQLLQSGMASPTGKAAKLREEAGDGSPAAPSPKRSSGAPLPAAAAKSIASSPRLPSLSGAEAAAVASTEEAGQPAAEAQPEQAATVEANPDPRASVSSFTSSSRTSLSHSTRPSVAPRMPSVLRTASYDVEPTVVESTTSSPVHRASVAGQPAVSDPRKLAAQKRREEAQRRVSDMKRQRDERIQAQAEARRSSVASDDVQDSDEIEEELSPAAIEEQADEEKQAVAEDAPVDAVVALKEGEVKYWAGIGADGLKSARGEEARSVKVVDAGAAERLASPPQDIQKELALLRKPQRSWGMGLHKEDDSEQHDREALERPASSADGARAAEEMQAWQSSLRPLRPSSATNAEPLQLPVISIREEGAFSISHFHTSPPPPAERSPPRILEQSTHRTFGHPHHILPATSDPAHSLEPSLFNPTDSTAAASSSSLDPTFVLNGLHPTLPPHPDPDAPLTPVAARRVLRVEEGERAMAALQEGMEKGLSEAAARRWLLMEELMGEVKERGERWRLRREKVEGKGQAELVELRRRLEVEDNGWEGRLKGLKEISAMLRVERRTAREARRRESARRKEEREREAAELKAMREDVLREKEMRRRRKREEKEERMQARLQMQRRKEEEAEERRRAEEAKAEAERCALAAELEEADRRRERERRQREEQKAEEEEKVRELQERVRAQLQAQQKEEKERRKAAKEEAKKEETKQRVIEALAEVERQAVEKAQQLQREQAEREQLLEVEEQVEAQRLRQLRVGLHAELGRWMQERQRRRAGEDREHRRMAMEEEEKRREEVLVMRQHRKRARSSPPAAPSSSQRAEPALPQWRRPVDAFHAEEEAAATSEEVELRKEERLRVELHARKALERLLTQRTFLHLAEPQSTPAVAKQRRTMTPPLLPPLLPPLHPAPAFSGEEEKTAISLHSPSSSAPAAPPAAIVRHPPMLVQGNPSLHSGWSWRPDLMVREIPKPAMSPILPPSVVKKVREREGRAGMALSRGREEAEGKALAAPSASALLWGAVDEEFELVGKKQRAFVKRRHKKQPSPRHSQLSQHQQPQAQPRAKSERQAELLDDQDGRMPSEGEDAEEQQAADEKREEQKEPVVDGNVDVADETATVDAAAAEMATAVDAT